MQGLYGETTDVPVLPSGKVPVCVSEGRTSENRTHVLFMQATSWDIALFKMSSSVFRKQVLATRESKGWQFIMQLLQHRCLRPMYQVQSIKTSSTLLKESKTAIWRKVDLHTVRTGKDCGCTRAWSDGERSIRCRHWHLVPWWHIALFKMPNSVPRIQVLGTREAKGW